MSGPTQALARLSAPVASFAFNPLVTGVLLFALTKAPPSIQEPLLQQLAKLPGAVSPERVVKTLKWLLALGTVGRVNGWLNGLATNSWALKSDRSKWDWQKEIAVVTGGCSGIGELVVKGLLEKGVRVAVLDVQPLPETLKSNPNILHQTCDISDPDAVTSCATTIRSTFGPPSVLVNNAGIGSAHTIFDTTPKQLNKIFGVNLLSHWYTVGEFVPDMAKKNKGHVVTIASMACFVTVAEIVDYACTKSGALAFHEGLTQELRHRHSAPDVHTTVVHPNWVKTPLVASALETLEKHQGPLLTADFVADEILKQIFACRGGQLILPTSMTGVSGIRGWPNWIQERLRDSIGGLTNASKAV
ncbi:NAD(P)-binding protein [Saccharata proteae CBS 121410]|uniref:Short-chain dehydrogenase/reductase 3 n=1 Tax=Saccharata proteae CBS 121410 TaxID=1314787 RepID=A0A9P4HXU8_9PEZI|nr:NAD(P)-binding protein [Saccharata proteae CBS 121410]